MTARWSEVDDVIAALCADVENLAKQSSRSSTRGANGRS